MSGNKAKVLSWYSISGVVSYELELAHDGCRVTAKLLPNDEKVIGKPEIGEVVTIWHEGKKTGRYIITERNGKRGPSEFI